MKSMITRRVHTKKKFIGIVLASVAIVVSISVLVSFFRNNSVFAEDAQNKINIFPGSVSAQGWVGPEQSLSQDLSFDADASEFNFGNSSYFLSDIQNNISGTSSTNGTATSSASKNIQLAGHATSTQETASSTKAIISTSTNDLPLSDGFFEFSTSTQENKSATSSAITTQATSSMDMSSSTPQSESKEETSLKKEQSASTTEETELETQFTTQLPPASATTTHTNETSSDTSTTTVFHTLKGSNVASEKGSIKKFFTKFVNGLFRTYPSDFAREARANDIYSNVEVTSEQKIGTCENNNPVCSTEKIEFSDFGIGPQDAFKNKFIDYIQLRMSLSAEQSALLSGDRATTSLIKIEYTYTEQWESLGDIILHENISNKLNGGYFLYALPSESSWGDLDQLRVRLSLIHAPGASVYAYLDGIWLEIGITDKNAFSADGFDILAPPNSPPINKNNQEIKFIYTEEESGDFSVRTDQSSYNDLTESSIMVSVKNRSNISQLVKLNVYATENFNSLKGIEKWTQNIAYEQTATSTLKTEEICISGWEQIIPASGGVQNYKCSESISAQSCVSLSENGTYCTLHNATIEEEILVQKYKNKWRNTPIVDQNEINSRGGSISNNSTFNKIPDIMEYRGGTELSYRIEPGVTKYFKVNIAFKPQSSGNILIKALGDKLGEGGVTPSWESNWQYRIPIKIKTISDDETIPTPLIPLTIDSSYKGFWEHVNSLGNDIRVINGDGSAQLPFYISDWDFTNKKATLYINLDRQIFTTPYVYIYFGKNNTESKSSVFDIVTSDAPVEKYYFFREGDGESNIDITSLIDDNSVFLGTDFQITFDQSETTSVSVQDYSGSISAKGPLNIKSDDSSLHIIPSSFRGRAFILPALSSNSSVSVFSLSDSTSVTIKKNGEEEIFDTQKGIFKIENKSWDFASTIFTNNPAIVFYTDEKELNHIISPIDRELYDDIHSPSESIDVISILKVLCGKVENIHVSNISQTSHVELEQCQGLPYPREDVLSQILNEGREFAYKMQSEERSIKPFKIFGEKQTASTLSLKKFKHSELISQNTEFSAVESPQFTFSFIPSKRSIASKFLKGQLKSNFNVARATIKDPEGDILNIPYTVEYQGEHDWTLTIQNREFPMSPGIYTISAEINENGIIMKDEQEFFWGILAMNTTKSVYTPRELMIIQGAVLSDTGHTICDADLALTVTTPEGIEEHVQMDKSGKCKGNNVTDVPDYTGAYSLGDEGDYKLTLMKLNSDGSIAHMISEQISVVYQIPFDITRKGPTRIYPPAPYIMEFTILANEDFYGEIVETLPQGFIVTDINASGGRAQSTEGSIRFGISMRKGETKTLGYTFDAPDISPYIYLLGPLTLIDGSDKEKKYFEKRQWHIASDAIGNMIVLWDSGAAIPAGWTCLSCGSGTFFQKYIRGASTYGGTGGTVSHTPTASGFVALSSLSAIENFLSSDIASVSHTHTYGPTIGSSNNLPLYRDLRVIQNNVPGEPATLPAGVIVFFDGTLPLGWTRYGAEDGFYVRGENTPGATGGSNSHVHTISGLTSQESSIDYFKSRGGGTQENGAEIGHTHQVGSSTPSINSEPPFRETIMAKLNADADPSPSAITMWSDTPPSGWISVSGVGGDYNGRFIKGSPTSGTTGGNSTHQHADMINIVSQGPSTLNNGRSGTSGASEFHTHLINVTGFSTENHVPSYIDSIFGKKDLEQSSQIRYHWRNDNGSEAVATSATAGIEDTALTGVTVDTIKRLRIEISNTGATTTTPLSFRLEFSTATTGPWTAVASSGTAFITADSTFLTEGNNTTNIAVALGGVTDMNTTFLTPNGGVRDISNQTGPITLTQTQFVELEYSIKPTNIALVGQKYYFRVSNAGVGIQKYKVFPEFTLAPSPPALSSILLNGGNPITLTENSTTTINLTATVTDPNGFADLVSASSTAVTYRSGVGENCAENNNNCYVNNGLCVYSGCAGNSCTLTCPFDLYYFSEPTDIGSFASESWVASTTVYDTSALSSSGTTPLVELFTLYALSASPSMSYGSLVAGTSTGTTTSTSTITNSGNAPIDIVISGTNMNSGPNNIAVNNQKYATSTFDYDTCFTCVSLTTSPTYFDLSVLKVTSTSTPSTETLFWGLFVPTNQPTGNYNGTNTFTATGDL